MDWKDEKYVGWTAIVIICELREKGIQDKLKIAKAIQRLVVFREGLRDGKYKETDNYLDWKNFKDRKSSKEEYFNEYKKETKKVNY